MKVPNLELARMLAPTPVSFSHGFHFPTPASLHFPASSSQCSGQAQGLYTSLGRSSTMDVWWMHPLCTQCDYIYIQSTCVQQAFTLLTGTASWGFSLVYLRTLSKYSLVYLWERVLLGSSVP